VMVISKFPNVACIMKSSLMDSVLFGSGARLAHYIRNDPPLRMIKESVRALADGSFLLIFPEGTRTVAAPLNAIKPSIGLIAKRAQVPVQTLLIETDSAFLSKGWPLLRRPNMPMRYKIRLGKRFEAPTSDATEFVADIEAYLREELNGAALQSPLAASAIAKIDTEVAFRERQPYA
jgi:1-acyl-sn-glycerol-3-phosphate acyltransferase